MTWNHRYYGLDLLNEQGYSTDGTVIYQDDQSAILYWRPMGTGVAESGQNIFLSAISLSKIRLTQVKSILNGVLQNKWWLITLRSHYRD